MNSNDMKGMNSTASSLKMLSPVDITSAVQELNALTGTQFDTAYTQMMVMDHQNAVALFERGAASSDADVKSFATKHLPTLRNHLQQIQSIAGTSNPGQQTTPGGSTGTSNQ